MSHPQNVFRAVEADDCPDFLSNGPLTQIHDQLPHTIVLTSVRVHGWTLRQSVRLAPHESQSVARMLWQRRARLSL